MKNGISFPKATYTPFEFFAGIREFLDLIKLDAPDDLAYALVNYFNTESTGGKVLLKYRIATPEVLAELYTLISGVGLDDDPPARMNGVAYIPYERLTSVVDDMFSQVPTRVNNPKTTKADSIVGRTVVFKCFTELIEQLRGEIRRLKDIKQHGSVTKGQVVGVPPPSDSSKTESLEDKNKVLEARIKTLEFKNRTLEAKNKALENKTKEDGLFKTAYLKSKGRGLVDENMSLKGKTKDLKAQIEALQSRVRDLEAGETENRPRNGTLEYNMSQKAIAWFRTRVGHMPEEIETKFDELRKKAKGKNEEARGARDGIVALRKKAEKEYAWLTLRMKSKRVAAAKKDGITIDGPSVGVTITPPVDSFAKPLTAQEHVESTDVNTSSDLNSDLSGIFTLSAEDDSEAKRSKTTAVVEESQGMWCSSHEQSEPPTYLQYRGSLGPR